MRRRAGAGARIVLAAAVLAILVWAPAGCGGRGGEDSSHTTTHAFHLSPEEVEREHQAVLAEFREVSEAELVDGRQGWARTGLGVFWTADGGRHWRRITPPTTRKSPVPIVGVWFRDPRHGWALAEEGHEGDTYPVFFSTHDGGRHWRRAPTPIRSLLLSAAEVSFSAVSARRVFALVKRAGDTAENFGLLLSSDDGGRTWQQTANPPPKAGQITFESARDGWLAAGYPGPGLWRTEDGGRTWSEVRIAPPPSVERVESASFLPPRIGTDGHGLLAAVFVARPYRDTTAALYVTHDRGRHWRLAATKPLPGDGGWLEASRVLAFRGDAAVVVHPPVEARLTILGPPAGRGPTFSARDLPSWAETNWSGGRFGFAGSTSSRVHGLRFTEDGGRSWRPLGRVRASAPDRRQRCPGRSDLHTRALSCATARRVLRDFFGSRPKIDPGPSPAGWACRQRQGDHTSDGGVALDDFCHSVRDPRRRLHLFWTTGVSADRRLG